MRLLCYLMQWQHNEIHLWGRGSLCFSSNKCVHLQTSRQFCKTLGQLVGFSTYELIALELCLECLTSTLVSLSLPSLFLFFLSHLPLSSPSPSLSTSHHPLSLPSLSLLRLSISSLSCLPHSILFLFSPSLSLIFLLLSPLSLSSLLHSPLSYSMCFQAYPRPSAS